MEMDYNLKNLAKRAFQIRLCVSSKNRYEWSWFVFSLPITANSSLRPLKMMLYMG